METPLDAFRHRGARALVILHDHHMRRFPSVWWDAEAANVTLPATSDQAYDAMPEHAVMHPIRHAFQLEELLADQRT